MHNKVMRSSHQPVSQTAKNVKTAAKKEKTAEKKPRAKKTDGLKQTSILDYDKPKKTGGRKKTISDRSDDDFAETLVQIQVQQRKRARRAASKKINYCALLGEDDDGAMSNSGSEAELFDNTNMMRKDTVFQKLSDNEVIDDTRDDVPALSDASEDSLPLVAKKKAGRGKAKDVKSGATKAAKRPRKRITTSDSDKSSKKSKKKNKIR